MNPGEFFQEDNGGFSATRLAFLLWALGVLVVWIIASIRARMLQPIDSSVITILGILMGGKVVQKWAEEKPSAAGAQSGKQSGQ